MILHNTVRNTIYIIFLISIFLSCKDPITNFSNKNTDDNNVTIQQELFTKKEIRNAEPTIVSDIQAEKRMKFNSSNSFNIFMYKIAGETKNLKTDLSEYIKNKYDFKSLRYYQKEDKLIPVKDPHNQTATISSIDTITVEDPYLGNILNQKGVVQIDSLILDIDNDYGYIYFGESFYENHSDSISKSQLILNYNTNSNNTSTYNKKNPKNLFSTVSQNYVKFEIPDENNGSESFTDDTGGNIEDDSSNETPNKRSKKYKSGGKKRKFKGVSWNRNYLLYASIGAKSVHKTKKLGKFWKSRADKMTLETMASWKKSFDLLPFDDISLTLKTSVGDILSLAELNNLISQLPLIEPGGKIEKIIEDIKVTVLKDRSTNMFNLDLRFFRTADKKEFDTKKVIKRFDFRTAIFSTNSGIKKFSKKFNLEFVESTHTMQNDGYNFNFKTRQQ